MRRLLLGIAAFTGLLPALASGQQQGSPPTSPGQTEVGAPAPEARPAPIRRETPDQVIRRYHLAGEVLVARGDRVLLHRAYGTIAPRGGPPHRVGERWRLASITKQVAAAAIMATPEAARLDQPVRDPALPGLTMRQLLTHHSGLPNTDATPRVGEVPGFYTHAAPDYGYCTSRPPMPGAPFSYNNCDYLLAFRAAFGGVGPHWPRGMAMARPGELGLPGFVHGAPEPRVQLSSYGAAGGLMGTVRAVFDFDRSLMTDRLLPPAALAELWRPEGNGSAQAIGQWVFRGQLHGCAAPTRIVQRDGEIYGVQARNFILPDDDLVVIVFTNRSADDFAIGEVWQRSGFAYDLLSAAACP